MMPQLNRIFRLAFCGLLCLQGCLEAGIQTKYSGAKDDFGNNGDTNDSDGNDGDDGGQAPEALVAADLDVIGGLRVGLDGRPSRRAKAYLWKQTAGPVNLALENADQSVASVIVPSNAPAGSEFEFSLTVSNDEGAASTTTKIKVHAASFGAFNPQAQVPSQIDGSEGLGFNAQGLWSVSFPISPNTQGFVSLFDKNGAFVKRYNVAGTPDGANFRADGKLVIANISAGSLQLLDPATGSTQTLTDRATLANGGSESLSGANYPLVDQEGNVYVSNNAQKVWRYDAQKNQTRVFLDGSSVTNPNGMAFGPESDRVYIGVQGAVKRVQINADGTAGAVETYFSAGNNCGVDGIAFDSARNMYVCCLGDNVDYLYVVPYVVTGTAQASRAFASSSISSTQATRFVNPRFGTKDFGTTTLYWSNLQKHILAKLVVGLPELKKPLAPFLQ